MNILYLHCHDAGRHLSPYGAPTRTPHLQKLAETGMLFRQAFCCGPTCSPSRAALLTGQNPHTCGMLGLAHRGFALQDASRHLASYLNQQGFETVLSGVQHEFKWNAADLPYQHVLHAPAAPAEIKDPGLRLAYQDRHIAAQAAHYLQQPKTRPFFLSCGFILPHRHFPAHDPARYDARYLAAPPPLPDTPEVRRDYADYLAAAESMDTCCGMVLQVLRDAHLEKETVVVFTVDHGIAFPGMKCNLYDSGIGVALIVRVPGQKTAGQETSALVSQLDIFPTLVELTGLPKPGWLEGRSFKPLLNGESQTVREEIFAEVNFHAAYEPMRAIRTDRYKYIRLFHEDTRLVAPNCDDSPTKELIFRQAGLWRRPRASEQLYDLWADPWERANLVGQDSSREIHAQLSARLDNWMRETADPLLNGPLTPPPGSRVNDLAQYSPSEPVTQY